jgi:hypothetical protein
VQQHQRRPAAGLGEVHAEARGLDPPVLDAGQLGHRPPGRRRCPVRQLAGVLVDRHPSAFP